MPVEAQRIKDRFKTLFGTVTLSKTRLDEISDKLKNRLPEDADDAKIDEELNFLNDIISEGYFSELQKRDDRVANEKHNKPAVRQQQQSQTTGSTDQNNTDNQQNGQTNQQQTNPPQQVNQQTNGQPASNLEAMLQQVLTQMQGLSTEVQTMKQRDTQLTLQQKAEGLLKDAPATVKQLALLSMPKTEEEYGPWSENIKTQVEAIKKEFVRAGGNTRPPSGGGSIPAMTKEQADAMASRVLDI